MIAYLEQFGVLEAKEIALLLPYISKRTLKKNEFLIQEGMVCQEVFFIEKGILRSYITDDNGNEITYCFSFDGEGATAYSSFLSGEPTQENIQAITGIEGFVVTKSAIIDLTSKYSGWAAFLQKVTESEYRRLEERIFSLLKDSASKRYRSLLEHHPLYLQNIPLHYLASYLGVSKRHLTRLRGEIML